MSGGEERYWPRPQNPNTRKILCFTGGQRSWAQSPDVLAQGELVGWKVRGPCRKVWKKHPPALCFLQRLHQGLRTQAQVQVPQPPEKSKLCLDYCDSVAEGVPHLGRQFPQLCSESPGGLVTTCTSVCAYASVHLLCGYKCGIHFCVHQNMCSGMCALACVHACVPTHTHTHTRSCMHGAILHQF